MQLKEAEKIMCKRYFTLVAILDNLRQRYLPIASLIKRTLNLHLQHSSEQGGSLNSTQPEHGPIASGGQESEAEPIYGQLSTWIYGLRLFFFKIYISFEVWPWTALQGKPIRMTFIV